uniref:Uncharacterized protein n=1 Tax=Panagrolaimus davidi TaxID=227884 RepID=A0A914P6H4_9BILA
MAMKSDGSDINLSSYEIIDTDAGHHLKMPKTDPIAKTEIRDGWDHFSDKWEDCDEEKTEKQKDSDNNLQKRKDLKNEKAEKAFPKKVKSHPSNRNTEQMYALFELIATCIFIIIVSIIAFSKTSPNLYKLSKELKNAFVKKSPNGSPAFQKITQSYQIWEYLENQFLDQLFWNDGICENDEIPGTIINGNYKLIGPLRIRMLKVRNDSCEVRFGNKNIECYGLYSKSNEDMTAFKPMDSAAFFYTEIPDAPDFSGDFGIYSSGGFIQEIPTCDRELANKILQHLKLNSWINRGTRVVFIEFTTFNFEYNFYTIVKLYFEILPTGTVVPKTYISTLKFFGLNGVYDYFVLICKLSIATIILTLKYEILGKSKTENLCDTKNYVEMDELVQLFIHQSFVIGILAIISWIKLFKYASFNKKMDKYFYIAFLAVKEFLGFSFVFVIVFSAFLIFGHVKFGAEINNFSNFGEAFFPMLRFLWGDFGYFGVREISPIWWKLFILAFFVFVIVFQITMLLKLITVWDTLIDDEETEEPKKWEIDNFLRDNMKLILAPVWLHPVICNGTEEFEKLKKWRLENEIFNVTFTEF